MTNTECKVVDVASGDELGPGEDGEIWIRGPHVMKGYLNNPDATSCATARGRRPPPSPDLARVSGLS